MNALRLVSLSLCIISPLLTAAAPLAAPSVSFVQQAHQLDPGESGAYSVACPISSLVTGGGVDLNQEIRWYGSLQFGNGWQALAATPSDDEQTVTVYAMCLSGVKSDAYSMKDGVSIP